MKKQNINYIGSKYSLLNFIYEQIKLNVPDLKNKIFCDIFAGTNIVSMFFKDKVKKIISNDIEYYSYVLANAYLSNDIINQNKIDYLNNLIGVRNNFFNYYCENGKEKRLYFSEHNGIKIDSIRLEIEKIKNSVSLTEYYILLSSLLESSDKVANTASVYGAFLKKIKPSAQKKLILKPLDRIIINNQINDMYNMDSNELIKNISGDILYIDPPYNHRQYGSNYHILNMIAKYDFSIEPKGIAGLTDYNKSLYCSKVNAKTTFENLIKNANFKHIFISYNNEGIITSEEMFIFLNTLGEVILYEKEYKTFKADSKRNNKSENTSEYLYYLKK